MELLAQLLVNGVVNGSEYALLGLGFSLIFATTRIFHFAYGPLFALSAFFAWLGASAFGVPELSAVLCGALGGAIPGAVLYLGAYRVFERKGISSHGILILSLGMSIMLQALITIIFGTSVRVVPDYQTNIFLLGPVILTEVQLCQVIALIIVVALVSLFLGLTRQGLSVLAMTDNRNMAQLVGIDSVRTSAIVFAIGSAIAGIAAALVMLEQGATTTMGARPIFIAFVVAVVGGIGSIPGSIIGGFLLGIVESAGLWQIPTQWQNSIAFVLLFVVMLARPAGLIRRPRAG
jgi:branched-chain amino acid transport system permease protein